MVTTRSVFDRQLRELRDSVQQLADMVSGSIENSMRALFAHDHELARAVDTCDTHINRRRLEIEEMAYTLLACQQPVSSDMRTIVASVSVVTNLERIADHAAGIARLVLRMSSDHPIEPLLEFGQMADLAKSMLKDAITAYVSHDLELAQSVIKRDVQVDKWHHAVYGRLIKQMSLNPEYIEPGTAALWVSHNLERMGDRCANICERVIYLVTGELQRRHDPMP